MNNLVSRPQLLARTKEDLLDLDATLAIGVASRGAVDFAAGRKVLGRKFVVATC
jgi:hypothetical protein